jgi:chromate transporter
VTQPAGESQAVTVPLRTVASEWTRIGVTGFGGPPTHIALLHQLVVSERSWISDREFEDAVAACNLLPGPASTQLAIFCARRVAGPPGAAVGGLGFIAPAVIMITVLSAVFLVQSPPAWIRGAGAGAGSAIAAVAVRAAAGLLGPSWRRARGAAARRVRWVIYVLCGALAAWLLGPYLVPVLVGCGLAELGIRRWSTAPLPAPAIAPPLLAVASAGGLGSLAWVAFKVGALSFGGGFVIVPLMRADAVHTYHWLSSTQFLSAVALGQVTPGPVVATVAAVGYAAHGVTGAVIAALVAFTPSFLFVLLGAPQFGRLRGSPGALAFLAGAGSAAIGAILGAAIVFVGALREPWQFAVLAASAVALLVLRRGLVESLLAAGLVGAIIGLAGGAVP